MKTFTKIFTTVVAGVLTLSCVTDTTEDLGVNLGEGQTTTISIALDDEARTYIGEADGNSYPMYWSEGDKISINGTESQKAVINSDEPTKASFVVAGVQQTPYCIAYPAAPAGQVKFVAEQTHKNNTTFGDGVTTMYGYGDGSNLTLKSLTGILKIGITGSAKLTKAQISTIDRAPIAGAFDFDFEKGEIVKAAADAKDVIGYSFGEGVQLSNEPTYMHIAVPAGVYDELYVTLYDTDGGVMYATVKAYKNDETDKSLKVGTIREFQSPITYTPNDSVFVIKDKASLKAFAEQAATLTKDVIFVADVDMTDEAWTPIEGYTKTINGNGYAIEGLSAPLFGTTSAKIRGLHLTKLNAEWTTYTKAGAFAIHLAEGGVLSHCSTEGNININNTTHSNKPTRAQYEFMYAGLVAYATGATIEHCENNANITLTSLCAESVSTLATHLYGLSFGGVVGATELLTDGSATSISHVVNRGQIYFANKKSLSRGYHWMGGVFGRTIGNNSLSAFHHCVNYGYIHSVRDCEFGAIRFGGVFGDLATNESVGSCEYIHNYGDIDIHGAATNAPIFCGIGYTIKEATDANNCLNKGNITIQTNSTANMYVCGGILGLYATGVSTGMKNEGNITVKPYGENGSAVGTLIVVGLTNNLSSGISGIAGSPSGNSGNIDVSLSCNALSVAGIAYEIRGALTNVVNSGNITVSSTSGANANVYGIGGPIYTKMTNVHNTGNITYSGTATAGSIQVAGICYALGNYSTTTDNENPSSNSGTITFNGKALDSSKTVKVAGYAVILNYSKGMSKLLNKGNVVCVGDAENVAPIHLGGLACDINHPTSSCENRGTVSFSGVATSTMYASGIGVTMGATGTLTNVTNNGKITSTGSHNAQVRLSGIIGYEYAGGTLTGARNNGNIEMNGEVKASIGIAGIWPVNQKADATFTDCHNSGIISVISSTVNTSSNNIGGLVGYTAKNMTFDACSNSGKTVDGVNKGIYVDQPVRHGYFDIAGCVGYVYKAKITFLNGFTNSADIYVKATNTYAGTYPVGGVLAVYNLANASYEGWTGTIKNTGKITFEGDASASSTLAVGGIIGISGTQACEANLVNTGNIIINKETAKIPATNGFGGIMGIASGTIKNAKSLCSIEAIDVTANIGFITGSARNADTVVASNCVVGGKICTSMTGEGEAERPNMIELSAGNYYNYIYGSADWTGVEGYDGCKYISAIDAEPAN